MGHVGVYSVSWGIKTFGINALSRRRGGGGVQPAWTAHWLFNEGSGTDVADSGPNGHDGTITGTGSTWGSGYLDFDGTNAYVDCGTAINLGTASFRWKAYITGSTPQPADYGCVFTNGCQDGTEEGFQQMCHTSGIVYSHVIDQAAMYRFVESTTNVLNGSEHFIEVVIDRGNNLMKVYVDTVEEDSADITGLVSLTAVGMLSAFARNPNSGTYPYPYDGQIQDAELAEL